MCFVPTARSPVRRSRPNRPMCSGDRSPLPAALVCEIVGRLCKPVYAFAKLNAPRQLKPTLLIGESSDESERCSVARRLFVHIPPRAVSTRGFARSDCSARPPPHAAPQAVTQTLCRCRAFGKQNRHCDATRTAWHTRLCRGWSVRQVRFGSGTDIESS